MQKVVITGASSGIGKATARLLLSQGCEVYGLCRRVEELESGVIGIACDLEDTASVHAAFDALQSRAGGIDVLVNNAGVAKLSRICDGSLSDWDTMWMVNVRGLALSCQLGLKQLDSQRGQIINVSSMSGHRVPSTGGFYAPTKFAVRGITDALRNELKTDGSRIRVSSVSPGFVDTPLLDDYFQGREEVLEATKQSMQMLTSEDIASAIVQIIAVPQHVEVGDIQMRSVDQSS
jgi:NADP-dependent 3-hydroxy acid dehydrogenase YdfG